MLFYQKTGVVLIKFKILRTSAVIISYNANDEKNKKYFNSINIIFEII